MRSRALGSQVRVVYGRMQRDGCGGTTILEGMFKDDLLQLLGLESVVVIEKHMVVNRSSCALDGNAEFR